MVPLRCKIKLTNAGHLRSREAVRWLIDDEMSVDRHPVFQKKTGFLGVELN